MTAPDQSACNPMLIAAVCYARRGWAVLPCVSKEKLPAAGCSYKNATTQPSDPIWRWKRDPGLNVAIATGARSKLFVLDVDPRNGGTESLEQLQLEHEPLPATLIAETGGDGLHYFRLEEGVDMPTSSPVPGIDFKGSRGHVLAPPSMHPSGKRYQFRQRLNTTPLAPMPAWLMRLATAKNQRKLKARSSARVTPSPAAGSELGKLFAELSMLGPVASNGVQTVIRPWEEEHSSGRRFNTSTVILPPTERLTTGGFDCTHSHCAKRTTLDAVAKLEPIRNRAEAGHDGARAPAPPRRAPVANREQSLVIKAT